MARTPARVPIVGERWRFKRNRGSGTFTVTRVEGDHVWLRACDDKSKRINLRTLRGDYEPVAADERGTTAPSMASEVRWTMTDRGFKHYAPITTPLEDEIIIYESSNAAGPHLWVSTNGDAEQITLEQAAALRDHPYCVAQVRATLAVAIERHYQLPQPDPAEWKAGDPCEMCGSPDTGGDEGAAFCRSCGADDRHA